MKYRLAILDSHPIQYRAPLFKKLAQHPQIDLDVFFCLNFGLFKSLDPGFGIKFKWDIPLLEGYRYRFLKNYSLAPSPNRPWGAFNPGIIRKLVKGRYDAIIVYGYYLFTNWIINITANFVNIPILFIGETVLTRKATPMKNLILNFFFRNIRACLYIGTKSLEFYRNLGIPSEHLFFTPYCVDNDFFINETKRLHIDRRQIKKEAGIPDGLPVILYASKMISRKRPQDLLTAFERLQEKAVLLFVGDGKLKAGLEKYVFRHKIKHVFFLGFKNQTELPLFFAISDIFVLPSSFESWGLVINEAMCAGLPILTTTGVAAAYDLVKHDENGFVLPPGDAEKMADVLNVLVNDPGKRERLGARSLEIISQWHYDKCVHGILNALEYIKKSNNSN